MRLNAAFGVVMIPWIPVISANHLIASQIERGDPQENLSLIGIEMAGADAGSRPVPG